ncbi:MAG: protein kinase [Polyangiaceae bacterium]
MSAALVSGSLFGGRYRVLRCIAQGGMGAVYEVAHTETGRHHALKVTHAHILASEELRERFRKEARVAANVQSEFIVDVFDAGVDAATDMPYLVMELLQGEELGKLLERRGRLAPAEVVTFLGQVALALDKTHRAMIVHRDLKPENLFLTFRDDGSPRVKVLDFGVAKVVAENQTQAAATRSVGTPLYMAPEQFLATNKVAPATDLFSFALIAYTLLTGDAYWTPDADAAGNVFAFAAIAMAGPKEPASARAARRGVSLPPAFDAWFARGTQHNPAQRFTSATEMVRALSAVFGLAAPAGPGPSLSSPDLSGALPAITGSNPAIAVAGHTTPIHAAPPPSQATPAGHPAAPAISAAYSHTTDARAAVGVTSAGATLASAGAGGRSKVPVVIGALVIGLAAATAAFLALRPSGDVPPPDPGAATPATSDSAPPVTVAPSSSSPEPEVTPSSDPSAAATTSDDPAAVPSSDPPAPPIASASTGPGPAKTARPPAKPPTGKTARPPGSSVYIRD